MTFDPTETITENISSSNETSEESRFNNYIMVNEKPYVTNRSIDLLKRSRFYEQKAMNPGSADVDGIVIIGAGEEVGIGKIEVYVSRPSYTPVTNLVAAGHYSTGNPVPNLPMPIIRGKDNAFKDCREGKRSVNTTDIDLYALGLWYEAYLQDQGLELEDDGILIYASRSPDATFTNNGPPAPLEAIRLVTMDATSSPQLVNETTLATDNPIYIHGDFNTISTHGVALIGDAINILSDDIDKDATLGPGKLCGALYQDWADEHSPNTTTVNAAFFAGHVPTLASGLVRGGGLHNYPRLHEDWQHGPGGRPVKLNINGAIINLWDSEQADSAWCNVGECYFPPQRNWGWDVRFQDPGFWPPLIPSIFSCGTGRLSRIAIQRGKYNEWVTKKTKLENE